MMLPVAVSIVELGTLGTLALAAVAVGSAFKIFPGQRSGLHITNAQGAAKIRDDYITTLQRDLERKNDELERQDSLLAAERALNAALRAENETLRARAGRRWTDTDAPPP